MSLPALSHTASASSASPPREPAGPSAVEHLRKLALDARTTGRLVVRDLSVELVERVLTDVARLEQDLRAARFSEYAAREVSRTARERAAAKDETIAQLREEVARLRRGGAAQGAGEP